MEISSEYNIRLDARYRSSELLVKRLVERSAAEEVLKKMGDYEKYLVLAYSVGTVEYIIRKREVSLPDNCVPVTKSQLKSLEFENQ